MMEELDILFVNLHRRYFNYKPRHGGFLGIYLLSAFVRQEGYSAKSFSGTLEEGKKYLDKLCQINAISMIGLYCDFENVTENIFLSNYIKKNYNLPVIVGGPQATALDENFFTKSKCDAVVRYEGELTVLELMNYFLEDVGELSKILGISYMIGNKLRINPERPLIKNLDALPFIDEDCYLIPKHFYNDLSLMTGRGCPFKCTFCHEGTHTRSVRFRSVENVLAEIETYLEKWMLQKYNNKLSILFTDDTLTLNIERVQKLCEGLVELRKKCDFQWFCEGHIHTMYKNPKMIEYMAKSGCYRVQLGIEAGTEKVLKAYGKNTTPEEILEVVRLCRDAGIKQIYGNIILAGAHFNSETLEADKKFVRQILSEGQGTVEIGTVTFWPLPETKMTRCPQEFGLKIRDAKFLTSAGDFPQIETTELDRFTIAEIQREFEEEIHQQMIEMLNNWQVPIERILSWFSASDYGVWFVRLMQQEILFSYYEMIKLGEAFMSKDVSNIYKAHPVRVVPLYKYIRRISESEVEICRERFIDIEVEIITLTTGKLSVEEIAKRVGCDVEFVMSVLNRLERKHFIVYSLH